MALNVDDNPRVAAASSSDVAIVVVVPLYKHSVFVADAVQSACAQETAQAFRVVIVNDGCPYEESQRACVALAAAYPEKVDYVRTRNAGLSAARNAGVDYALGRWPGVRAFFFLDADNRIEPRALARAFAALMSDAAIGWAYPDIATFGATREFFDYSGPYSALRHLLCNVSEAGSMVRREVFDRGLRFCEDMRLGYEDWEFWWQCLEAGFKGTHVPMMGLRYRTRAESMVSETRRNHWEILAGMRRRHAALFRAKALLAMQAAEAPRYALVDGDAVRLCSDIDGPGESIALDGFTARYAAACDDPYLHVAPNLTAVISPEALSRLRDTRLARYVLWWLERRTLPDASTEAAAVEIHSAGADSGVALSERPEGDWPTAQRVHIMAFNPRVLNAGVDNGAIAGRGAPDGLPTLKTRILRVELGGLRPDGPDCPDIRAGAAQLFDRLRHAGAERPPRPPSAKTRSILSLAEARQAPHRLLDCAPLLSSPGDGRRDVALVAPDAPTAAALESVAKIAAAFRDCGWRAHLVALAAPFAVSAATLAAIDGLISVPADGPDGEARSVPIAAPDRDPRHAPVDAKALAGLLLPMDAVVNIGCDALHEQLARLKGGNVATVALLEKSALGDAGVEDAATRALAFEHVYDLIATDSPETCDWLHAFGAPRDKLLLIEPARESGAAIDAGAHLARKLDALKPAD